MKSSQGLMVAFATFAVLFFFLTAWSLFHMAGLYDRIHKLEATPPTAEGSRNEVREPKTVEKSDPMRNFTAKESEEWLQYYEDTPENRKKWAEAGTPMRFEKK